jgi:hypothetical protein
LSNEIERHQPKSVTIVDTTIPIIEYKGQRVITLAMMDKLHHRTNGTAKRNFLANNKKFNEGKHYFNLSYKQIKSRNEFRTAGIVANSQGLIVITERGYSMLVKSFTDDFAWEVQDQLVDSYFDSKKPMSTAEFLVQQATLILEHDRKINRLEQRQNASDLHIAETRNELRITSKKADDAMEAAAAALYHKYGESDYYTIVGFCNKHNIKLHGVEPKAKGAEASHASRKAEKKIIKVPDDRWGSVNSYHISILQEVFNNQL